MRVYLLSKAKSLYKKYLMMKIAKTRKVIFHHGVSIDLKSRFEGGNLLSTRASIIDSSIGFGSCIGEDCRIVGTEIGKYCAFGPMVRIIVGQHPTKNFVSIHPAFYSLRKQSGFTYVDTQKYEDFAYAEATRRRYVIIGNDVWVGAETSIINGVTIGDGAIIGAKSLVISDIEPYCIYAGNPARKIRDRFPPKVKEFLVAFRWWEKSEEWLIENADLFQDYSKFLSALAPFEDGPKEDDSRSEIR